MPFWEINNYRLFPSRQVLEDYVFVSGTLSTCIDCRSHHPQNCHFWKDLLQELLFSKASIFSYLVHLNSKTWTCFWTMKLIPGFMPSEIKFEEDWRFTTTGNRIIRLQSATMQKLMGSCNWQIMRHGQSISTKCHRFWTAHSLTWNLYALPRGCPNQKKESLRKGGPGPWHLFIRHFAYYVMAKFQSLDLLKSTTMSWRLRLFKTEIRFLI